MTHRGNKIHSTGGLIGLMFVALAAHVVRAQDDPAKTKAAEKSKAEARKIDVQVKVSAADGKPVPAGSTVEISGQETTCGTLNSTDATKTIDDKGEAMFRDLPACKVTVKMNLNQYLPVRKVVDLTGYKSCLHATALNREGDPGPAQPACEAISLVLGH